MCDPEIWNVCCRHWVDIAQERAHGCYRKQGHRAGPPSPAGAWVMPLCAPYLNMEHEHGFTIYPDKDKYWSCFGPIFPICDPTFPFWDGNVSCVSLYIGKIYFVFWYRGPHFRVCLSLRRDFGLNFLNCILLFIFGVCVYVCTCIYVEGHMHVPWSACWSQRITWGSLLCPFTMWVPGSAWIQAPLPADPETLDFWTVLRYKHVTCEIGLNTFWWL